MFKINKKLGIGLVLAVLLGATPTAAIEYGGVGGRPANPDPTKPKSDSIFTYTAVKPGQVIEEQLRVINNTAEPKSIAIYPTDSILSSGGAFACKQRVEEKTNVGAWLELETDTVQLDSLSNQLLPFKIRVPENIGPGEHNGCIAIQEIKDPKIVGSGIAISTRTALRVSVVVNGPQDRVFAITKYEVKPKKGSKDFLLHAKVKNIGNVSGTGNLKTTTKRWPIGETLPSEGGNYNLLPNAETEYNFVQKQPFWGWWYKSNLTVKYEALQQTPPGTFGQPTTISSKQVWLFSWPQPKAAAIEAGVLVVLLSLLWLLVRRIRKARRPRIKWRAYKVTSADSLQSIAERHRISVRKLAKVNGLRSSYLVQSGQTLQVPLAAAVARPTAQRRSNAQRPTPTTRARTRTRSAANQTTKRADAKRSAARRRARSTARPRRRPRRGR